MAWTRALSPRLPCLAAIGPAREARTALLLPGPSAPLTLVTPLDPDLMVIRQANAASEPWPLLLPLVSCVDPEQSADTRADYTDDLGFWARIATDDSVGPDTAAHPCGINDLAGQVFLQVTWGF